jgi:SAM-dependent methyltransferase
MKKSKYIGEELTIFKDAKNWKNYWYNSISEYIAGDLLEVGAGIGANTNLILQNHKDVKSIVCIEPDKSLAHQIMGNISGDTTKVKVLNQYLNDLSKNKKFDTILYIDVIEHIEVESAELNNAKLHLKEGGVLIILVPAYNCLYSRFDKEVGHYRRYNKKMLIKAVPKDLANEKLFYLDSLGVFASVINKLFVKQKYPTKEQIRKWDKLIIPVSKIMDRLVLNLFGKSLIGVWINK